MYKGNQEFLEDIFRRYFEKIYTYCRRLLKGHPADLAEDCTQITFLHAGKQAAKLKSHPNIEGWLYRTSRNQVNSAFRKQYTKRKYEIILHGNLAERLTAVSYDLDEAFLATVDIESLVEYVLSQLDPREHQLYTDYFQRQLTITQLASKYHLSQTAVTSRIYRLKKKIKVIVYENIGT